ncbi:hypothetical protein O9K51_08218 [Purpureocillium lavendulum]|uniref:Uncharacterized protein n=1 Tax=Purpureocillium lavendulum TaxID=1247861 RepID=A0AB34FI82_9HYPO|nr:hypothetical protein O9K51_08218 [Purpureocillium lavendulum]
MALATAAGDASLSRSGKTSSSAASMGKGSPLPQSVSHVCVPFSLAVLVLKPPLRVSTLASALLLFCLHAPWSSSP